MSDKNVSAHFLGGTLVLEGVPQSTIPPECFRWLRGLLYWAREVRLEVYDNYKDLFKYIKLFKLMQDIHPIWPDTGPASHPQGYHITLHGPISPFVTSTIRYGLQFAKFMPAVLLCNRFGLQKRECLC